MGRSVYYPIETRRGSYALPTIRGQSSQTTEQIHCLFSVGMAWVSPGIRLEAPQTGPKRRSQPKAFPFNTLDFPAEGLVPHRRRRWALRTLENLGSLTRLTSVLRPKSGRSRSWARALKMDIYFGNTLWPKALFGHSSNVGKRARDVHWRKRQRYKRRSSVRRISDCFVQRSVWRGAAVGLSAM